MVDMGGRQAPSTEVENCEHCERANVARKPRTRKQLGVRTAPRTSCEHPEVAAIARRREADYLLHLEAYCRVPECPAREVRVHLKDYDQTLLPLLRKRRGLRCPVCGGRLALHSIQDRDQEQQVRHLEARWSVNAQLWERDHGPVFPVAALCDDRLPPTPPGWFDQTRTEK